MKNISSALQLFLIGNTVFGGRADLIDIVLLNGQVLHVVYGTNQNIVYPDGGYNGSAYVSGGPTTYYTSKYGTWERGAFENSASFRMSASDMELSALVPETVLYPGTSTPLMQVLNAGMLSGARVAIRTIFWPQGQPYTAGIAMGYMVLTVGQIGNIKSAGRSKIVCQLYDLLYQLVKPVPPFQIQSACRHNLFDAGCTLNVANFQSTAIALAAGSTNLYLNLAVPARANSTPYVQGNVVNIGDVLYLCTQGGTSASSSPTFDETRGAVNDDGSAQWTSQANAYPLGYVLFTGGQNAGLIKTIKAQSFVSGVPVFQLWSQMAFPVAPGDTVIIVPGCDKTVPTCGNVFDNFIHYGGQPYVPNPEVAT